VGDALQTAKRQKVHFQKARIAALLPYAAIAVLVIGVLSFGYHPEAPSETLPLGAVTAQAETTSSADAAPLDQVTAATIAAGAAQLADMSINPNVQNLAVTLTVKNQLGQTDETTTAKPQIVSKTEKHGVIHYTAQDGDTVPSLAAKFEVSADTIRWANDLVGDSVETGSNLTIPAVDGVLYTVKNGDTAQSLATKYKTDAQRIISYNDAELTGLTAGQQIVLPGGVLPEVERPGYVPPAPVYSLNTFSNYYGSVGGTAFNVHHNPYRSSAGDNRSAFGYCTWWVFEMRVRNNGDYGLNGKILGDARYWNSTMGSLGYRIDKNPEVGAIFQTTFGGGGYGHVAYIIAVNRAADGSVIDFTVSEMNWAGWNMVDNRTIPGSDLNQAGANIIH
jgi:surface antigen